MQDDRAASEPAAGLTRRNLAAAHALAAAGCPVLPCDPESGQPHGEGTGRATTDIAALDALWQRHPAAVPAIDLGKAGLLVIELTRSGGEAGEGFVSFFKIADACGWDAASPIVSAPDGLHIYFRQPQDEPSAGSGATLAAWGIQVRGHGALVVAPGAARADGADWAEVGNARLAEELARGAIPPPPGWLRALLRLPSSVASRMREQRRPLTELLHQPPLSRFAVSARAGADAPDPALWRAPDLSWLGSRRSPPPPFPPAALGDCWGAWCAAHAQARGTPVDYVAGTLLAVTAALLGNRRWPHASAAWREPPALWVGLLGAPASGKTPGQEPVLDLVRAIERQAALRLTFCGSTPDASAALLRRHPAGLLLQRDELGGWLGRFHRGAGDSERELWLASHGGRPWRLDRVDDPQPGSATPLAASILGAISPERLAEVINGPARELCLRFLWCWPEPAPAAARARAPIDDAPALSALRRFLMLEMTTTPDGASLPGRIDLSGEAAETCEAFAHTMKARALAGFGVMAELHGKAAGQCLRLAAALAVLDWSAGPAPAQPPQIERTHVERAAQLVEHYFLPMAKRAFGEAAIPQHELDAMTLARWLRQQQAPRFNSGEARRRMSGRLRAAPEMDRACATLVEAGLIRPRPSRSGSSKGRLRSDYEVNPAVREFGFRAGGKHY